MSSPNTNEAISTSSSKPQEFWTRIIAGQTGENEQVERLKLYGYSKEQLLAYATLEGAIDDPPVTTIKDACERLDARRLPLVPKGAPHGERTPTHGKRRARTARACSSMFNCKIL